MGGRWAPTNTTLLGRGKEKESGEAPGSHCLPTGHNFWLLASNMQREGTSPFSLLNPLFPSLPPSPNHPSTACYKRLNIAHSKLCLWLSKKELQLKMSSQYAISSITTNIRCKESLIANINWGYQKGPSTTISGNVAATLFHAILKSIATFTSKSNKTSRLKKKGLYHNKLDSACYNQKQKKILISELAIFYLIDFILCAPSTDSSYWPVVALTLVHTCICYRG